MAIFDLIIGVGFLSFFGPTDAYAHVFRIALLLQIVFLIYTSFRPAKWKWGTLYVSNALFAVSSLCVLSTGLSDDDLSLIYFGISAMVYAFILSVFFPLYS